jgi:ABC-2 type transport system ATP-binding protein
METIVSVKNLRKTFKVNSRDSDTLMASFKSLFNRKFKIIKAVDGIDFEIKKGEIRGLIGPNGAGKSTTLKILCGILYPSSGDVNVMGFIPWKEREKYVKNIGVVFGQKGQLAWELPAIDTYALHKQIYKIPSDRYRLNLEFFIDTFNISDIVNKPVRNLSLGERMKCEIICSLIHSPELVFLDEPTIGLDVVSKDIVRKFIKKINKEKDISFILTTHDLSEVESLCEQVTIINHGKIVYDDKTEQLKSQYSNIKIVEIKLQEPINTNQLNGWQMEHIDPLTVRMIIDMDKTNFKAEISSIMNLLPVKDLNFQSVDIETMIKNIYQQNLIENPRESLTIN